MLDLRQGLGRRAVDPAGTTREHMLASYLPYVTGVGDDVLMLRDGDVMASFVVAGIEADTADETLDRRCGARHGQHCRASAPPRSPSMSNRVSHETAPTMPPVPGDGFAARIDRQWQGAIAGGGLRERVSIVSVVVRPQRLHGLWLKITGGSKHDLRAERGPPGGAAERSDRGSDAGCRADPGPSA